MKIAIICGSDPYKDRLDALNRFFTERGDHVTLFLPDFQHREKKYYTPNFTNAAVLHVKSYKKNLSFARIQSHINFAESAVKELYKEQWDLLWVLVPPNSLVKQCVKYKKTHPNLKLIFDINDMWPESLPFGEKKWFFPYLYWSKLRDKYLNSADYIVTECKLFQTKLQLSDNCKVIYLCKEWSEVPKPAILNRECINLCYLGSMNHILDIDAIILIALKFKESTAVKIHLIGTGEKKEELLSRLKSANIDFIDYGPVYTEKEKQIIFDQCHYGLNTLKSSVIVGLTMKSIDYLAGGLPIINTIPGDTMDLINAQNFGVNWSEETSIQSLISLSADARKKAREFYIANLTYQSFADNVSDILAKM